MGAFSELKRRNVFRMAVLYVISAWLVMQVAGVLMDLGGLPAAAGPWVLAVLVIGFPIALVFSWFYELTPEGISLEKDVPEGASITHVTGRRLDFVIIAVLAAAVLLFAYDKWWIAPPAERSVAVLPFVAMSSGEDDGYFADGLTEEILNSLAQLPELQVTARTSSFFFKGKDVPIAEIATKLGVAHVVEGSVRRAGEQVRITAQLIRAADGFHLWSDSYDHSNEDGFDVQTEIAEKIAAALSVILDEEQLNRMRSLALSNPEALIAYQKGVELYDRWHDSGREAGMDMLFEANDWFDKALALSPGLSRAYVYHSDPYVHLLMNAGNEQAIHEEELTAAFEQISKDLRSAVRYALNEPQRLSASFDLAVVTGKWRGLTATFDQLVEKQSCGQPLWLNVPTLAYGKAREFLTLQQELISCDPLNYYPWLNALRSYIWLGEYDAAIEIARKGLEATSHPLLSRQMVNAYIAAGQFDQAEIAIARDVHIERRANIYRAKVAAAKGDATAAKTFIDNYVSAGGEVSAPVTILLLAIAGERDLVNKLSAELDARPFGYFALMTMPYECFCGAPFDLQFTPNFARLIEDAELPWPPASPIEWPLKDW